MRSVDQDKVNFDRTQTKCTQTKETASFFCPSHFPAPPPKMHKKADSGWWPLFVVCCLLFVVCCSLMRSLHRMFTLLLGRYFVVRCPTYRSLVLQGRSSRASSLWGAAETTVQTFPAKTDFFVILSAFLFRRKTIKINCITVNCKTSLHSWLQQPHQPTPDHIQPLSYVNCWRLT